MSNETTTTGLQTWSSSGRVVLTVTPEGRVVPGEGLQMDAVARELLAACGVQTATIAENARLRERVAELEAVVRDVVTAWDGDASLPAAVDRCEAALAQADETGGAR